MQPRRWLTLAVLGALVTALAGCGGGSESTTLPSPYTVEEVAGTDFMKITITPKAAKRLDIQTAAVQEAGTDLVIPYGALLYETDGATFAYVSPKPLTFVREEVVVDRIEDGRVFLSKGPAQGTTVVTVGVAELHGAESGLGAH